MLELNANHEAELRVRDQKHAENAEAITAQLSLMFEHQRAEALASQCAELEAAAKV